MWFARLPGIQFRIAEIAISANVSAGVRESGGLSVHNTSVKSMYGTSSAA
jgi:hypothetical protein